MSKANIPSPNSGLPEPIEVEPDWGVPPEAGPEISSIVQKPTLEDLGEDWQTVDFPNALSVDAIPVSQYPPASQYPPDSDPFALPINEAQITNSQIAPPSDAELISLIQELNQCNNLLLDRVSQLETSLEISQNALKAQIRQAQAAPGPQTLAAAQEQITQLLHQVEFSNQANQRQQILVETFAEQLQSSQERVAQLERECAVTQQRCNEQAQQLMENESACRDLRTRLQRQQRYTLQFKVALEKCLDVPPPSYETVGEAIAQPDLSTPSWNESDGVLAVHPFLPKVARIQPWSSQPHFLGTSQSFDESGLHSITSKEKLRVHQSNSDLLTDEQSSSASEPLTSIEPLPETAVDSELADLLEVDMSQSSIQQTPAVVQPLAVPIEAIEAIKAIEADVMAAADAQSHLMQVDEEPEETHSTEAQDTLWQDLARLIEVSTEDVVMASSAEDFSEFVAQKSPPNFAIGDEPEVTPPALAESLALAELPALADPWIEPEPISVPTLPVSETRLNLPSAQSNWPSPVVYPLRPTRKLRSLAAVDLPTFPR
jgi:hypothetical protein